MNVFNTEAATVASEVKPEVTEEGAQGDKHGEASTQEEHSPHKPMERQTGEWKFLLVRM